MERIERVKIFYNQNEKSEKVYKLLIEKLKANNLQIVEEGQQLNIAIGGDGAFIRMLKQNNYSSDMLYVGVNTGTLGFLQEVEEAQLDDLIESIIAKSYKICATTIQKNLIKIKEKEHIFYAFNEIVIRRQDLSLAKLDILIDENNIERFVGDAIMLTTSVGSTAHASSYGSAIVHDSLEVMQVVPAGAFNSVINQTLKNPLILPSNSVIKVVPTKMSGDLTIAIDGENYDFNEVENITTTICNKKINRLRLKDKDFYKKINSKFIQIKN